MGKKRISFAQAQRGGIAAYIGWMGPDALDHPSNRPWAMEGMYQSKILELKEKCAEAPTPPRHSGRWRRGFARPNSDGGGRARGRRQKTCRAARFPHAVAETAQINGGPETPSPPLIQRHSRHQAERIDDGGRRAKDRRAAKRFH